MGQGADGLLHGLKNKERRSSWCDIYVPYYRFVREFDDINCTICWSNIIAQVAPEIYLREPSIDFIGPTEFIPMRAEDLDV